MKSPLVTVAVITALLLSSFALYADTAATNSTKTTDTTKPVPPPAVVPGTDGRVKVTFKYIPGRRERTTLQKVTIAGDFNNWNTTVTEAVKDAEGNYVIAVELKPATYVWKILIDGNWIQNMETVADRVEPKADRFVKDPYGGVNCQNDFVIK
ncbi:MAG: hypothetical protein SFY80_10935 [Verrucomicrobiota bacterium]|nr:hypothetical protein [Verrucomicrobiota bacterium]